MFVSPKKLDGQLAMGAPRERFARRGSGLGVRWKESIPLCMYICAHVDHRMSSDDDDDDDDDDAKDRKLLLDL